MSDLEKPRFMPDLGALVHFEHVNLAVPCHRLATLFFIEGLGLTRDPFERVGTDNMWVNVGTQQFHLPLGDAKPFCGEIGLAVPDLNRVEASLRRIQNKASTPIQFQIEAEQITASSPWGHRFCILQGASTPQGEQYPLPLLGIPYIALWVAESSAAGIAQFYEQLHCPVRYPVDYPLQSNPSAAPSAVIQVGPQQQFRFIETTDPQHLTAMHTPHPNHVAVYASAYRQLYATLEEAGLIWEAHQGEQFRFKDIVCPQTKAPLLTLEHEVRSVYHPEFRKPLLNRNWSGMPFSMRHWQV